MSALVRYGWLVVCAAFGLGVFAHAQDARGAAAADETETIASFDEYWRAGLRDRSRPIRAEVLVTYYDPAWGHLWGEIDGIAGYMRCAGDLPIRSFDRIRIEGNVVPDQGISLETARVTVEQRDVAVEPDVANDRLKEFDNWRSRLVMCDVVVGEEQFSDGNHLVIDGVADGLPVHVYHWMVPPQLIGLKRGDMVRVTGVYNAKRNEQTGLMEIDLWAGHLRAIVPFTPAMRAAARAVSDDGAAGPVIRTFGDFFREDRQTIRQPIDLEIAVTFYDPGWGNLWGEIDGQFGFLQCGPGLPIRSRDRVRIQGNVIPAHRILAEEVVVTTLERDVAPAVLAVEPRFEVVSAANSRVVTCEVTVESESFTDAQHLRIDGTIGGVTASVHCWSEQPELVGVFRGGIVRVTGLCVVNQPPEGGAPKIDFWIARPEDVQVIATGMPDKNARVVDSFAEFYRDEMSRIERPMDVRMVVVYYDPIWLLLWGEMDGNIGYFPCKPDQRFPFRAGDRVRLHGSVIRSEGLDADRLRVTVEESGVWLPALQSNNDLMDVDRYSGHVVTGEMIVDRPLVLDANHVGFDAVADGVRFHAIHHGDVGRWAAPQSGNIVRVRALYFARHDPRTRNVEVDLWLARPEDMEVVGDLSADARFQQPLIPLNQVMSWGHATTPPVHVVGVVREFTPGREIVLRDDAGQVVVQSMQTLPLKFGDVVEAWGEPMTLGADSVLRRGIVRPASTRLANELLLRLGAKREIHLADEVLALQPEEAAKGRPVSLRGIITWGSEARKLAILRDGTAGVQLDYSACGAVPLVNSNVVRIHGTTVPGPFVASVKVSKVEFFSTGLRPPAKPVTFDHVRSGQEEGQTVELRGLVREIITENGLTRLRLSTSTGEFTAVLENGAYPAHLIGSLVAVTGVCQALANDERQLTGIELWCEMEDGIRVLQEAPTDPFAVPLRSIRSLRQFDSRSMTQAWARVRGVVTHQMPGRFVVIQEGAQGLLLLTSQEDVLKPGVMIEATGLPGYESERLVLREAVVRRTGEVAELVPAEVSEPRHVIEAYESRLVRLSGVLLNLVADGGAVYLALQSGERVFNAVLPGAADNAIVPDWHPGSKIELTGVYEVIRDERRQPDGFRVQLRSADDVVVVRRPPWWTPRRAVLVMAALLACVAAGLSWAAVLRRRVTQQTVQIRQQLEHEAKLEARHRDLFEKASDFIFTTDREGRFITFNPAGERVTGYTRDEALRLNLRDLLDSSAAADELVAGLREPRDQSLTVQRRLKTRDGREIWAEASVRFIFEHGEFTGLLGVIRDISARKQVEEELKRARDAAEANTQARSAFLANMSHEIRTPMNGVIGMSNLLLDTALQADQREYATTIRTSAESLLTVLNDILDFSKIEAGRLTFESVEFDLVENIEDTIELITERVLGRPIELVTRLEPDLPLRVCGDPGRLRQVMLNLLGNAVKFTEAGEITVHVARARATDSHLGLRIAVSDTGIGISPEAQRGLFQPFAQADVSTTRRFGGTGLGLAISKQIVSIMGGEIGVESTVGCGSTFWFTVNLAAAATPADNTLESAAGAHQRRALAIDAHPSSRSALVACATACGLQVQAVASVAEARDTLSEAVAANAPFGIVLLDAPLAGSEFEQVGALVRNIAAPPAVILVRELGQRFAPSDLTSAGIKAVIRKPLRRRDLRAVLGDAESTPLRAAEATLDQARAAGPETGEAEAASPLRILVAEDNVVNQRLIVLQLRKLGFACNVAVNGVEALDALARDPYDVVLMDCQMPEMDGFETTRRIRTNPRIAGIRIIAMTANAMRGDREKCLAAGMDDYVSKPVRLDALLAALRAASPVQIGA